MTKHTAWLHAQIQLWISEGIIEQETGNTLLQRYPSKSPNSRSVSLLTVIGAVIFGLGVILFFAFNWSEFSKPLKLALIIGALLLTHGTALVLHRTTHSPTALVEGFYVLGTMMFGAGIWLIAQIYHIDEHYPTAFLVWGSGALVLAWAIPSVFQAIMACVLITVWGISEVMDFQKVHVYSIALIVLGVLPLAWRQHSSLLLFSGLVSAFVLTLLNIIEDVNPAALFYMVFATATLLMAGSVIADKSEFPGSGNIFRLLGVPIYAICLFAMTFTSSSDITDIYLSLNPGIPSFILHLTWMMLILAMLAWAGILYLTITKKAPYPKTTTYAVQHALVLVSLGMLMQQASGFFVSASGNSALWYFSSLIYNAILVAHCITLIIHGTNSLQWKHVTLGCLALAWLVFARFNDLFHSLLMRSAVFLLLGATLFIIGHLYSKQRLKILNQQEAPNA